MEIQKNIILTSLLVLIASTTLNADDMKKKGVPSKVHKLKVQSLTARGANLKKYSANIKKPVYFNKSPMLGKWNSWNSIPPMGYLYSVSIQQKTFNDNTKNETFKVTFKQRTVINAFGKRYKIINFDATGKKSETTGVVQRIIPQGVFKYEGKPCTKLSISFYPDRPPKHVEVFCKKHNGSAFSQKLR